MPKSFGCQSFSLCAAVWLELCFLCLVTARIWPKSLSPSELSSAELVPSAISSERATPQNGAPKDNAQWADVTGLA